MAEVPEMKMKLAVDMAAVAEPGDTLVVALNRMVSDEEYETLRERFEPLRSTGVKVFIVENASSMVVVKGPEVEDEELGKEFPPSVTLEGYDEPGER